MQSVLLHHIMYGPPVRPHIIPSTSRTQPQGHPRPLGQLKDEHGAWPPSILSVSMTGSARSSRHQYRQAWRQIIAVLPLGEIAGSHSPSLACSLLTAHRHLHSLARCVLAYILGMVRSSQPVRTGVWIVSGVETRLGEGRPGNAVGMAAEMARIDARDPCWEGVNKYCGWSRRLEAASSAPQRQRQRLTANLQ